MPRRRNRRRRRRRRQQVVRTKSDQEVVSTGKARQKALIYRGIGIPSIYCCKLKYSFTTNANSSFSDLIVRGNGAYDPEVALGGGQPMYWDQLASLYQRYTALSSSIAVTFVNKSGSGEASFTKVGAYPIGTQTSPLTLQEATERDNCKYAQLGPNTGDQGIITLNHYAKATAVLGKARDENTDDVLSSDISTTPARPWYWHIFAGSLDATTAVNVYIDVTVTYYIKFYDRREVARS